MDQSLDRSIDRSINQFSLCRSGFKRSYAEIENPTEYFAIDQMVDYEIMEVGASKKLTFLDFSRPAPPLQNKKVACKKIGQKSLITKHFTLFSSL